MRSTHVPTAHSTAIRHLTGWLVPPLALLFVACGTGPDERSGGDAGRGDAKPAAVDTLLYDRVGVDDGDADGPPVGLAQRAYPLIELLEWTRKEDGFILWEAANDF